MRIISGERRGCKLRAPEGFDTRPTTDRVKEAVFNIIQTRLPCGFVLDMFAGSGAMGIEALSRGAEGALFIDKNPEAVKVIKANLTGSGLMPKAVVLRGDAYESAERISEGIFPVPTAGGADFRKMRSFDIIFLDPPYNQGYGLKALRQIERLDLLSEEGVIVAETEAGGEDLSGCGYTPMKEARYGKTLITVFRR